MSIFLNPSTSIVIKIDAHFSIKIPNDNNNFKFSVPIIYHVDRVRDGKSFATRRVDAIQKGNVVFSLLASFQVYQLFPLVNKHKNNCTDIHMLFTFKYCVFNSVRATMYLIVL